MVAAKAGKPSHEKSKGHKVDSAGKKKQKQIAAEKMKNLKTKRDALNALQEKRKEELSKLKEDDPEYEKFKAEVKAEVDANSDTLMGYDNKMQALGPDVDMDIDDEDGTNEKLFVAPGLSGDSQSNPIRIDNHGAGTDTRSPPVSANSRGKGKETSPVSANSGGKGKETSPMLIDDDDEEKTDVLTQEIYNKATGQNTDGKVMRWRKAGWGK